MVEIRLQVKNAVSTALYLNVNAIARDELGGLDNPVHGNTSRGIDFAEAIVAYRPIPVGSQLVEMKKSITT